VLETVEGVVVVVVVLVLVLVIDVLVDELLDDAVVRVVLSVVAGDVDELEVVVYVVVVVVCSSSHDTETSSLCRQLWKPQGLCRQLAMDASEPVQWTLSSQIGPLPGPYLLCSVRPARLQYDISFVNRHNLAVMAASNARCLRVHSQ